MAGVLQSTVTLVLHNRPGVSEKTKQRVSELLLSNGYTIKGKDSGATKAIEKTHQIVLLKYQTHINNPDAPIMKLRLNTQLIERGSVCDYAEYIPPTVNAAEKAGGE